MWNNIKLPDSSTGQERGGGVNEMCRGGGHEAMLCSATLRPAGQGRCLNHSYIFDEMAYRPVIKLQIFPDGALLLPEKFDCLSLRNSAVWV